MRRPEEMRRCEILKNLSQTRGVRTEDAEEEGEEGDVTSRVYKRILWVTPNHADLEGRKGKRDMYYVTFRVYK